jgi:hypothetical protein
LLADILLNKAEEKEVGPTKKAMIALGLIVVILLRASYVYLQNIYLT